MKTGTEGGGEKVRWMATQESWADVVKLYDRLETVAFWEADNTLSVETARGRERVPVGGWICRCADGTIEVPLD